MLAPRNVKGWFKINLTEGTSLSTCYFWIADHCKGNYQLRYNCILFEKEGDAVYFGIGYK